MIDRRNELKETHQKYQAHQMWRLCREIPPERRKELVEEIKVKANLLGYQNGDALKAALKHLKEES